MRASRNWNVAGAAAGCAVLALAVPAMATAGTKKAQGVTVRVTGAYRHKFHLASCKVSPPQKGNPTVTWGILLRLQGQQDIFGFVQTRSNSPVGRIKLQTTNNYTATFVHGSTEWQAGFTDPGHVGSGTATVTRHVLSGKLSATLTAGAQAGPVHLTATWRCKG